jgi:ABC-type transport system involved in multi-copper enzyme maturation permease subunit
MLLVLLCALLQVLNTWNTGFSMGMSSSAEVSGDNKLLLDIGLATVFVCGVLMSAFVATAVISREVDNKTILTVVSKPVGRPLLIIGKFLGVSGAILLAVVAMLGFLLLAIRHGVLETSVDEVDQPVVIFGLAAIFISLLIAGWTNYFYGWNFPQTVVSLLAPLTTLAYILVLLLSKSWAWQPLLTDFKPQVTLTCFLLALAILVLTSIAVCASARLGQVMTIVVCVGAFLASLLSNYFVGQYVFRNTAIAQVRAIGVSDVSRGGFDDLGDQIIVELKSPPLQAITPGQSFYFGPTPNGYPLLVPEHDTPQRNLADPRSLVTGPSTLLVTKVEGLRVTVTQVGEQPMPLSRGPLPEDFVFPGPTEVNFAALAAWGVIPNLQVFWTLDAVSQNRPIPIRYVATATIYAAAQIAVFLSLAVLLFQRRDVG